MVWERGRGRGGGRGAGRGRGGRRGRGIAKEKGKKRLLFFHPEMYSEETDGKKKEAAFSPKLRRTLFLPLAS